MKINDRLYGFTVTGVSRLEEFKCDVYTLIYDKCGARLTYFDREDDNKTFSVSFKTLPEDNTGVFHIIEHSVLCGSDKYPLKDPFVELLKGSLNTFLNAMTFQDKTMYPVSSRNDRDFLNLISIYMDAVLHPLAVKSPNAFYQEGWHYELDGDGELSYKGVVLNEMRGAYSSADTLSERYMDELLYADTPYSYDSGGDPEFIPTLTYEEFCASHARFYHPSCAELFLDGSVRLDEVLPLIASFLEPYERSEVPKESFDIPRVTISAPKEYSSFYEAKAGEDTKNKTRISEGYMTVPFDDVERQLAIAVIKSALLGSNEARVKRKLLESGLCENLYAVTKSGIFEHSLTFEFINVKDGRESEVREMLYATLREVVEEGIDPEELTAALNSLEFATKEQDTGSTPLGIELAINSLESLLYSSDPTLQLRTDGVFASLRGRLGTGYFEDLVRELILDNPRRATVTLYPSLSLAEERKEREERALALAREKMSEESLAALRRECEELQRWQEAPDSDEAIATVPSLTLDDISREPKRIPTEERELSGVRIITHPIQTSGIVYAEMYFDISDVSCEELPLFSLLNSALISMPTAKRDARALQRLIKTHLGNLNTTLTSVTRRVEGGSETKLYFVVCASALVSELDSLADITAEMLRETVFSDTEGLRSIIKQTVTSNEEYFASSGHIAALGRVRASTSVSGAISEYYTGYESHLSYKEMDKSFDTEHGRIKDTLASLLGRYLTRERLTVCITGEAKDDFVTRLIGIAKTGEKVAPVCKIAPLPARKEGIAIPAQVSFAIKGNNLYSIDEDVTGSLEVIRSLVGYEYLWGEIRVKGGAYGAGMSAAATGSVAFYSYRDPSPARSLDVYGGVSDFLRDFAASGEDLTKYIIGAIGNAEPVRTPRAVGTLANIRALRGTTYEEECAVRASLIDTDSAELVRVADLIDRMLADAPYCVIGPLERLKEMKDIEVILEI
ncbi:MAG: insulinase family protein [Clostridia bacterium]|nr:insulinase family protein [Clostridia bacterium]